MSKFTKDGLTIETDVATEAAELRRDGFVEQPADEPEFDNGGVLPTGPSVVTNDTGSDEPVKPAPKPAPKTDK